MQSSGTSGTRNLFGSQKLLKEVVVGLDCDVEIIRDKLVEDGKQLDVVSIVVVLGVGLDNFKKCFPGIKELTSTLYSDKQNDFEELLYLETLVLIRSGSRRRESAEPEFLRGEQNLGKKQIRFPTALKYLSISRCHLSWSDMSIIQSLPNLVCLVLRDNGFEEPCGAISTLQSIEVSDCAPSLRLSLLKIQKEQYDVGNCELKITVDGVEMPSFVPTYDD
ncbi:hypothetical protein L2E82_10972 [Cichorium intybus]|uniref:Uncharacterized protein n=1 Tax=Cichorium intybus TaxID=13427 RepID=A0ACB9GD18_CICIN|nr:hypothetical protein L2E82_10972 [Cichorium intybus]